jgi:hypothetical protein
MVAQKPCYDKIFSIRIVVYLPVPAICTDSYRLPTVGDFIRDYAQLFFLKLTPILFRHAGFRASIKHGQGEYRQRRGLFAVPDVPKEHQEQRGLPHLLRRAGLRLSMVKGEYRQRRGLFAVPDVPSEHQEQRDGAKEE